MLSLAFMGGLVACQPAPADAEKDHKPARVLTPASQAGDPYCRQEILDPNFESMVAFTLNVPHSWLVTQSLQREWYGTWPLVQVWIMLRSPDGRQQIDYLPSRQYAYHEGAPAQGAPLPMQLSELDSPSVNQDWKRMTPAIYLRRHLLPQLARQGQALRDTGNFRLPPLHDENGHPVATASLDGTLPNGHAARVEVRLSRRTTRNGQTVLHMWSVVPSITQAVRNVDAVYAHTRVAQQSIVPNAEWLRLTNEPVVEIKSVRIDGLRITNWYSLPVGNTRLYYQYQEWLHHNEMQERRETLLGLRFRPE